MDYKKIAQEAIDILLLKDTAIHAVAYDRSKFQASMLCLWVGALASSLGLVLFPIRVGIITYRPDLVWVLGTVISGALGQMLVIFLIGILAEKLFKSKLPVQGFFQVLAYGSLANVLGLIQGFSFLAGIWICVLTAKVLHSEGKLETPSILLLLIMIILLFGSAGLFGMGYYDYRMM